MLYWCVGSNLIQSILNAFIWMGSFVLDVSVSVINHLPAISSILMLNACQLVHLDLVVYILLQEKSLRKLYDHLACYIRWHSLLHSALLLWWVGWSCVNCGIFRPGIELTMEHFWSLIVACIIIHRWYSWNSNNRCWMRLIDKWGVVGQLWLMT